MDHQSAQVNELKTYARFPNKTTKVCIQEIQDEQDDVKVPLTTLNAVKYLLQGTLRFRVCRYCLNVTSQLSEFDEVLTLAVSGNLHEVTIRDIVASFHPFKVPEDKNFPNKICSECVNQAISCYLFIQQCERAERALWNCFDDINDKFDKLDSIEPVKRRGKRKLNPNHNIIYAENKTVIDYAEPVINIVNITEDSTVWHKDKMSKLECQKCWQILPNMESLINHENSHPKSMWFNCRLCGKSFVKRLALKRHLKEMHLYGQEIVEENKNDCIKCIECGEENKILGEHLQHVEKHKFKSSFKMLVERKVDSLCTVCLEKSSRLLNLTEIVQLHGGYSGLTGEKKMEDIVKATIPGINLDTCPTTKICDKCYSHAISSYIFISKILHVRSRLDICVSSTLETLSSIPDTDKNLIVEISKEAILPNPMLQLDDIKENKDDGSEVEVLEDEFRISDTESSESNEAKSDVSNVSDLEDDYNPAKNVTKTYTKKKLFNGYQLKDDDKLFRDVCSEFLTFKRKERPPKYTPKCRYTCPFCNKHFISDYFLKKHILRHMQRKVQCNVCLKEFKSKFYLFEHKKMEHILNLKRYISCKICGRTFENLKKMKSHEKSHRIKECQLCDKMFVTQKNHDVHMQRHAVKFNTCMEKHVQTCSFCEKACSNENELSLHVNKVHLQIKPYPCDMCNKQFYTETNLLSHKKLHSLYSKETCAFCSKTFKCRKHLVVHVRKHIGVKPDVCPVCRQSFYSDSYLKKHMKIFHGGIYSCRLCRTVLPSQLDLKSHINLMHSSM